MRLATISSDGFTDATSKGHGRFGVSDFRRKRDFTSCKADRVTEPNRECLAA